jgi:cysteinyl-tRNA synthetase
MDWTEKKRQEAEKTLHSWRLLTEFVKPTSPSKKVIEALREDLNTPQVVISELERLADSKDAGTLKASANLLGLLEDNHGAWSWKKRPASELMQLPNWHPANAWIYQVTEPVRKALEQIKKPLFNLPKFDLPKLDFKLPKFPTITVDALAGLKQLAEYHERLKKDYPEEVSTVGEVPIAQMQIATMNAIKTGKVAQKILDRNKAKKDKDFARADEIREGLAALGVILVDGVDGTKWTIDDDFDPSKLEDLK